MLINDQFTIIGTIDYLDLSATLLLAELLVSEYIYYRRNNTTILDTPLVLCNFCLVLFLLLHNKFSLICSYHNNNDLREAIEFPETVEKICKLFCLCYNYYTQSDNRAEIVYVVLIV